MIFTAFANRLIEQEIFFTELPEEFAGFRIFFISDIHRRVISDKLMTRIKEKPDIIIIGGDLAEAGVPIKRVEKNLQLLRRMAPVYFIWGNNDYELNNQQLSYTMNQCDIIPLKNQSANFRAASGKKLALIGVDDMQAGRVQLQAALASAGKSDFNILISHNPRIVNQLTPEHRIHLVLCGHTHGGQIHILGYSPYDKGRLTYKNNTAVLISNGYGTTALPFRLGAKSETHLLELKRK